MVEAYAEIISMRNDVAIIIRGSKYFSPGADANELATRIMDKVFLRFMQNDTQGESPITLTVPNRRRKKKDDGVDEFLDSMELDEADE